MLLSPQENEGAPASPAGAISTQRFSNKRDRQPAFRIQLQSTVDDSFVKYNKNVALPNYFKAPDVLTRILTLCPFLAGLDTVRTSSAH